jgi:hypothetical protein
LEGHRLLAFLCLIEHYSLIWSDTIVVEIH